MLQLALLLSVLARRPAAGHQAVKLALLLSALARRPAAMKRAAWQLQPLPTVGDGLLIPWTGGCLSYLLAGTEDDDGAIHNPFMLNMCTDIRNRAVCNCQLR